MANMKKLLPLCMSCAIKVLAPNSLLKAICVQVTAIFVFITSLMLFMLRAKNVTIEKQPKKKNT